MHLIRWLLLSSLFSICSRRLLKIHAAFAYIQLWPPKAFLAFSLAFMAFSFLTFWWWPFSGLAYAHPFSRWYQGESAFFYVPNVISALDFSPGCSQKLLLPQVSRSMPSSGFSNAMPMIKMPNLAKSLCKPCRWRLQMKNLKSNPRPSWYLLIPGLSTPPQVWITEKLQARI